jgi:hypothetical protein
MEETQRAVSKFYRFKLFEVNQLYVDVFAMYRAVWPYLEGGKVNQAKMITMQQKASRCFTDIEFHFEKMFRDTAWTSKDHNLMKSYNGICSELSEVCKIVMDFHKMRNSSFGVHEATVLINRVHYTWETMSSFTFSKKREDILSKLDSLLFDTGFKEEIPEVPGDSDN